MMTEIHYGNSAPRPDIFGIVIPGTRGKLLSLLYTPAGPGPHPIILLFHGIPGNEQNLDLAQALRRAGFCVLTFHYSGCWGSEGSYSLSNDLEDANTVLDYVLECGQFHFDKARIYAVGHSLGGFVCAHLAAKRQEIQSAALLMPCDIGRMWCLGQGTPILTGLEAVLDESVPFLSGTSRDALLQELKENSVAYQLESLAPALAKKPLLILGAELDSYTPPAFHCTPLEQAITSAGSHKLTSYRLPTDHFAADYRIDLTTLITEYFLKQSADSLSV